MNFIKGIKKGTRCPLMALLSDGDDRAHDTGCGVMVVVVYALASFKVFVQINCLVRKKECFLMVMVDDDCLSCWGGGAGW